MSPSSSRPTTSATNRPKSVSRRSRSPDTSRMDQNTSRLGRKLRPSSAKRLAQKSEPRLAQKSESFRNTESFTPQPPTSHPKSVRLLINKLLKTISKNNVFHDEDLQGLFASAYLSNTHMSHKDLTKAINFVKQIMLIN